jgi:hypothetical protein
VPFEALISKILKESCPIKAKGIIYWLNANVQKHDKKYVVE